MESLNASTTRAPAHLPDFESSAGSNLSSGIGDMSTPNRDLTTEERDIADALIRLVPWARHAALDEFGRNSDCDSYALVRQAVRMGVGA